MLVLVVSVLTISATGVDKRPWEDFYRQLIKDTVDNGGWSVDLVDLDYDGTPELLMARYLGSGLFQIVSDAYTFRNGAVQKLHPKGEYDDFFRFYEGTYEGEKLHGFMTYYNPTTGAMKTEGYYLVRSGAAEHGMVFASATLNGTELSQQVLFAESTLTQTDTTTYYIGNQKVAHAAYTAAFQARNNGWTNVTPNGSPTMDSGMGMKPKDAEIDELFAAWTGGFHTVGSFKDVLSTDYFAEPVQWAASHDPVITDGTSDTTFSPNDPCTRGQVVTFLWRAMGCPEPKSSNNPFKDVNVSDYYGKASSGRSRMTSRRAWTSVCSRRTPRSRADRSSRSSGEPRTSRRRRRRTGSTTFRRVSTTSTRSSGRSQTRSRTARVKQRSARTIPAPGARS